MGLQEEVISASSLKPCTDPRMPPAVTQAFGQATRNRSGYGSASTPTPEPPAPALGGLRLRSLHGGSEDDH